jgi:predicted O-methyltransferase YrrM
MRSPKDSIYFRLIKAMYYEYNDFVERTPKLRFKPWMKYNEVAIIRNVLKTLKPKRCLEWGAGFSSLYFPDYLENESKWFSIEHDLTWFNKIKAMNKNPKCEFFYVKPNHFPWTDEHNDGGFTDLRDYLSFPSEFGKFDFILIDGRARNYCLIASRKLIENEGIVVLHDANRSYYEYSNLFRYTLVFRDSRKNEGGIMLGSPGFPLKKNPNINKDYQVWYWINSLADCHFIEKVLSLLP